MVPASALLPPLPSSPSRHIRGSLEKCRADTTGRAKGGRRTGPGVERPPRTAFLSRCVPACLACWLGPLHLFSPFLRSACSNFRSPPPTCMQLFKWAANFYCFQFFSIAHALILFHIAFLLSLLSFSASRVFPMTWQPPPRDRVGVASPPSCSRLPTRAIRLGQGGGGGKRQDKRGTTGGRERAPKRGLTNGEFR